MALEVEKAFGEALFEGDEAFGGRATEQTGAIPV